MLNTLDLLYCDLEVFTAVMETDVNSGIQILAAWHFSLEVNGK